MRGKGEGGRGKGEGVRGEIQNGLRPAALTKPKTFYGTLLEQKP